MGVLREEERLLCAFGQLREAPIRFESCQSVPFGGVMLLLPFLLECGLLSYRDHYNQRSAGFYNFDSLFILLAFLFLCRIRSFEQTKHYSPGEFGKLIGYDRIPEVKKLRGMIRELTNQNQTRVWTSALSENWMKEEEPELYYIDGHVQVYHGYLAHLGSKYVSRQRLCLPGMMEFWINASDGSPYFFVTAQVNEKMIEMLVKEIIPVLLNLHPLSDERIRELQASDDEPIFTLVFDREAWSPELFALLWSDYRIAVITYRKNVREQWDESLFTECEVITSMGEVKMKLSEQDCFHEQYAMREVRRLCNEGHQTCMVTTNRVLSKERIASQMFARWAQENFFRYMRQEYALDKIIQYSVDNLDNDILVVNREYSNITCQIKKEKEKIVRRKAKLYHYPQRNVGPFSETEDEQWMKSYLELIEEIRLMEQQVTRLINKRKEIPYKIPLSQMPEDLRYNRLNEESKALQNVIKMICYRAETALATLLRPHYSRANHEVRSLVKSIIHTSTDIMVDEKEEAVKITIYPLANKRSNDAVGKICEAVKNTNTLYPGTNLKMIFKTKTT
jgi:hypothetical protein